MALPFRMIINRQSEFHWQIVLVSTANPELLLKTGTLLVALNHLVPTIQPNNSYLVDFATLAKVDIIGTSGLPANNKVAATLKFLCTNILSGAAQPSRWSDVINNISTTSAVHFFSYIKSVPLARTKRFFINIFIAKKRSAEYDRLVFHAKNKEKVFYNSRKG